MTTYALAVFVVAALGGAVMALNIFRGKLAHWGVSLLHAALGATGLVLLVLAILPGEAGTRVTAALAILVVAALGGFYLASLHARKTVAPKGIVVVHAAVAVVGVLVLLTTML